MSTHVLERRARPGAGARHAAAASHWVWLGGGLLLAFLIPFVLADTLAVQRDLYYGLYGAVALGFAAAWSRATGESWRSLAARRWRLAVVLGLLGAVLMVAAVLRTEDAGERAGGLALAGQLLWRGVVYGTVDGLLLAALPVLIVFAAFGHARFGSRRLIAKAGIVLAAFAATLAMTGVYHLGYSDFRSDKVAKPMVGNAAWSVPVLATGNPVGGPLAHVGLHVAAVLRNPDSQTFLPPHE